MGMPPTVAITDSDLASRADEDVLRGARRRGPLR